MQRFKSECGYITELGYITPLPSCIKSLKLEFSTEALLWLQNIQRLMDHAEFHSWTTLRHLLAFLTLLLPFNLISPYFTTHLCKGDLSRSIFSLVKNNFRGGLKASADHSVKMLYVRDSWEMKNWMHSNSLPIPNATTFQAFFFSTKPFLLSLLSRVFTDTWDMNMPTAVLNVAITCLKMFLRKRYERHCSEFLEI